MGHRAQLNFGILRPVKETAVTVMALVPGWGVCRLRVFRAPVGLPEQKRVPELSYTSVT